MCIHAIAEAVTLFAILTPVDACNIGKPAATIEYMTLWLVSCNRIPRVGEAWACLGARLVGRSARS